jgi:hypothetical protein
MLQDYYDFYERPFCAESEVISVHQHKKFLARRAFQIHLLWKQNIFQSFYTVIKDALHRLTTPHTQWCYRCLQHGNNEPTNKTVQSIPSSGM